MHSTPGVCSDTSSRRMASHTCAHPLALNMPSLGLSRPDLGVGWRGLWRPEAAPPGRSPWVACSSAPVRSPSTPDVLPVGADFNKLVDCGCWLLLLPDLKCPGHVLKLAMRAGCDRTSHTTCRADFPTQLRHPSHPFFTHTSATTLIARPVVSSKMPEQIVQISIS